MLSATGKEEMMTAAFRVPGAIYSEAMKRAARDNVKISVIWRDAVTRGLELDTDQAKSQETQDHA